MKKALVRNEKELIAHFMELYDRDEISVEIALGLQFALEDGTFYADFNGEEDTEVLDKLDDLCTDIENFRVRNFNRLSTSYPCVIVSFLESGFDQVGDLFDYVYPGDFGFKL